MAQTIVVALLVTACAVYAIWTLLPAAARRALARRLADVPAPGAVRGWLRARAVATNACGCDGCDKAPGAPKAAGGDAAGARGTVTAQPIRIHRRVTR
ncbi:DUF6587 family protein [Piscinibacter koreensis]|uniref:Uncharacterized protein n=1 Tax=Piscinibacter koreensis TaxID=2742824 RepID=A0A7Y6NQ29_9BURK|nr:DUF6587 family protein [Schlegelella koreensis]NUZ07270.1 hypothetical protein [Schlegelella koreensis]